MCQFVNMLNKYRNKLDMFAGLLHHNNQVNMHNMMQLMAVMSEIEYYYKSNNQWNLNKYYSYNHKLNKFISQHQHYNIQYYTNMYNYYYSHLIMLYIDMLFINMMYNLLIIYHNLSINNYNVNIMHFYHHHNIFVLGIYTNYLYRLIGYEYLHMLYKIENLDILGKSNRKLCKLSVQSFDHDSQ